MTAPAHGGNLGRRLAIVASVVVIATIAASVIVNGTPAAQREIKLDERRARDLGVIEDSIQRHYRDKGALPASLAVLADKPGVRLAITDPETGTPYSFEPTSLRAYRLCATFTTDTAITRAAAGNSLYSSDWAHGMGRVCFDRAAEAKGG